MSTQHRVFLWVEATPMEPVLGTGCVNTHPQWDVVIYPLCQLVTIEIPCYYFNRFFPFQNVQLPESHGIPCDFCFEFVVVGYVKAVLEGNHSVF